MTFGQRARHLQPCAGQLDRQLCPREAFQRRVQAAAGVASSAGHAHSSLGQGGGRREVRPALRLGDAAQALGGPIGVVEVALGEMDVDEQREQRADHGRLPDAGNVVVRPGGAPL